MMINRYEKAGTMANKPVVYVTRPIREVGLRLLREECEVHVWDEREPPERDTLLQELRELEPDGLLCYPSERVDGLLLDNVPSLEVVSTYSVGYDHIDLNAAEERGVPVGHTPGVLTDTTADFAWILLTVCARRVVEGLEYVTSGGWESWAPRDLMGPDIHGSTLGISGLGNIGATVAKRTAGFDMEVLYSDVIRHEQAERELEEQGVDIRKTDQETLLESSDFVTVHVPLMDETEGMIGEPELRRMQETSILINASRGPVVDIEALDRALENDWIARAGLDVTEPEPLPAAHSILRHVPEKLIVTPHMASESVRTLDRISEMAAENLLAGLQGEPIPNSAIEDANMNSN